MACELKKKIPNYEIRLMVDEDINEVLDIWKENNLFEGKYSIQTFKTLDPNGFFVAVNLENEKIIGCCAGVNTHPECFFIGLYAVRKQYRGLGIGLKMFQKMMTHVGNNNAGLYPIERYYLTYRDKAGFIYQDNYEVIVYETNEIVSTDNLVKCISNVRVSNISFENFKEIINFDKQIVGHNRENLLQMSLNELETICRVAIDLDDGKILGYGCLRLSNNHKVICGPLYAMNDGVAELLLFNLFENFDYIKNGLIFMVPDINFGGIRIAKKLKIPAVNRLTRLFTESIPKADIRKIYFIHSPNFYPF